MLDKVLRVVGIISIASWGIMAAWMTFAYVTRRRQKP